MPLFALALRWVVGVPCFLCLPLARFGVWVGGVGGLGGGGGVFFLCFLSVHCLGHSFLLVLLLDRLSGTCERDVLQSFVRSVPLRDVSGRMLEVLMHVHSRIQGFCCCFVAFIGMASQRVDSEA